jgi:hypothetical protein
MSFPSFRTAAAAATLIALLGLSAAQVKAQPREHRTPVQVETHSLEWLWQWLVQALAPTDPHRGMTIDPNG